MGNILGGIKCPHSPVAEQGLKRLTLPRPRKPGSNAALRGRGKTREVGTVSLMLLWPEKVLLKVSPSRPAGRGATVPLLLSTRWCICAAVAMSMLAKLALDAPSVKSFGGSDHPQSMPKGCPALSHSCTGRPCATTGWVTGALAVLCCRPESHSAHSCLGGDRHTVLRLALAVRGTIGVGELERQGEGLGMRVATNSAGMCFSKSGERPRGDGLAG